MKNGASTFTHIAGLVAIVAVTALSLSCSHSAYPIPAFQKAPEVLDLEKLLADYEADQAAAAIKYQGKTFLFPGIEVDKMMSHAMEPHRAQLADLYVQKGYVRFLPKSIFGLNHVGPGFIVDVIGDVRGWQGGFFIIDNCIFIVVEGGELPPPMAY